MATTDTVGSWHREVAQTLTKHTGRPWRLWGIENTYGGARVVTWTNGSELIEEITRSGFTHWVLADIREQASVSVDSLTEILAELDGWTGK